MQWLFGIIFVLCIHLFSFPAFGAADFATRCGSLPKPSGTATVKTAQLAPEKKRELERLLQAATSSYRQQQFGTALDSLDAAYSISASADILFNRAQTCREAGAERAALALYEQAAAQTEDARLKTAAQKRAGELRRKLSRAEELSAIAEQKQALSQREERIAQEQSKLAEQQRRIDEQRTTLLTLQNSPPPPLDRKPPVYKRWWFWTAIGGAVAAVVVVSAVTAYEFPRQPNYPTLQTVTLH